MQMNSSLEQESAQRSIQTLDDLAALSTEQLWVLYREAKTPMIEDLNGRLVGRMLSVSGVQQAAVAKKLRCFSASGYFPWQGKSFESHGDGSGSGVNRVLGNRQNWFRFATFIGPSRAGDFDALHLNYDNPGNPGMIRAIKDEVREVAPGLWLGLAYIRLPGGTYHMALFFALSKHSDQKAEKPPGPAVRQPKIFWAAAIAIPAVLAGIWLFKKRH